VNIFCSLGKNPSNLVAGLPKVVVVVSPLTSSTTITRSLSPRRLGKLPKAYCLA
jgi:hypothetical protein